MKKTCEIKFYLLALSSLASLTFSSYAQDEASKVGLFIGSFDPITKGHHQLIEQSANQLGLTEYYIVINSMATKDYSSSVQERTDMFKLSMEDIDSHVKFHIGSEPLEGKKKFGENLIQKHGKVTQIYGQDVQTKAYGLYGHLPAMEMFVAPRAEPGQDPNEALASLELGDKSQALNVQSINSFSSTEAKKRLKSGDSTDLILAAKVRQYIMKKGLYKAPSEQQSPIKIQYMLDKGAKYFDIISKYYPQLTIPTLDILGEVSFTDTQSDHGSNEMLYRMIVKNNPDITPELSYQLSQHSEHIFKGQKFLKLYADYLEKNQAVTPSIAVNLSGRECQQSQSFQSFDPAALEGLSPLEVASMVDDLNRAQKSRSVVTINSIQQKKWQNILQQVDNVKLSIQE